MTYLYVTMLEETQLLVNVTNDGQHKRNVVLTLNNSRTVVVVLFLPGD